MITDTHCHVLSDKYFNVYDVIDRLDKDNIKRIIMVIIRAINVIPLFVFIFLVFIVIIIKNFKSFLDKSFFAIFQFITLIATIDSFLLTTLDIWAASTFMKCSV